MTPEQKVRNQKWIKAIRAMPTLVREIIRDTETHGRDVLGCAIDVAKKNGYTGECYSFSDPEYFAHRDLAVWYGWPDDDPDPMLGKLGPGVSRRSLVSINDDQQRADGAPSITESSPELSRFVIWETTPWHTRIFLTPNSIADMIEYSFDLKAGVPRYYEKETPAP